MLTRNKKLKDYGIPAEDIEKLNTMLKDFPAEYGYLLTSAALSACPKNTVIADMVIENIFHRKSYRKISKERYIPMNPKDFYGYRRKTVAVLYERMRLLGVWEKKKMKLIELLTAIGVSDDSCEEIQICHPGRSWEDYDTFNASSKLLKPFYDLEVSCLSAIGTDVIRVDLAFDEKGGEVDEQTD